jgi:Antibiotic biosynthesis monooxygenase
MSILRLPERLWSEQCLREEFHLLEAGDRMVIVSGQILVSPGRRDAFLAASREAMAQARRAPGCRDFVV